MNNSWTTDNIPDLAGKKAIVTGSNTGIGYETAKALAEKNAIVILAVRNIGKGQYALERILNHDPDAGVDVAELDLGNLASVRKFASDYLSDSERLDLLINNAGVMIPPYGTTSDGFELQWGTNHLGHFALTGLLLPLLLVTGGSRVVNVSSIAHLRGEINFDDLNSTKNYERIGAYSQSKLANLLFTYELQRRLEPLAADCTATAAHPGWTKTDLQRHSPLSRIFSPFFAQKAPMGALPSLRAATDTEAVGGDYFGPSGYREMKGYPVRVSSNDRSHNQETAQRLWEVSEELTGVRYNFDRSGPEPH